MKNNGLKYLSFVSMVFLQLEKTHHSLDECVVHPLLHHTMNHRPGVCKFSSFQAILDDYYYYYIGLGAELVI